MFILIDFLLYLDIEISIERTREMISTAATVQTLDMRYHNYRLYRVYRAYLNSSNINLSYSKKLQLY